MLSRLHRGCRLAYEVRGAGSPVLMIQGTAVHGAAWLPQVEALAAHHRCLFFDNRGMARSQPIGAPITVAQMAEDALVLMDAQGWESAHVVGHSLGGLIAQHLALSHRERVRSLSLLCTFARGRDVTRSSRRVTWIGLRTRVGSRTMRRRAFLELILPPAVLAGSDRDALAERLAPVFGHDLAEHPPVTMKQLRAMGAYDATPRLAELAGVPTLVASAEHDLLAPPRLGRALAAGIPGAAFVEIPGAAHSISIFGAEQVNALLLEHLASQ